MVIAPAPKPTGASSISIPSNAYISKSSASAKFSKVTLASTISKVLLKAKQSVQFSVPAISSAIKIKAVLNLPDGEKVVLLSGKTVAKKATLLPAITFKRAGSYNLILSVGGHTQKVTLKVS